MSHLVDLHAHVLPGIDDGPKDLDQALALARAAQESGTSTIAATPHLRSDFPDVHVGELADRCQAMRAALAQADIALELVCATEASLVWALEASEEDLRLASFGQLGTDLLIESPASAGGGLDGLVYQIRLRGYRVTLAHPERSPIFHSDPALLRELVRQGVLLQVNAESLVGDRRRPRVHRLAVRLCREGLAHAIASDGHRAQAWRPVTALAAAADAAGALVGPERARWMTSEVPSAILAGESLPEPPAIEGRSLVRRLSRRSRLHTGWLSPKPGA
jgi:protein-tyrosine phosphatase